MPLKIACQAYGWMHHYGAEYSVSRALEEIGAAGYAGAELTPSLEALRAPGRLQIELDTNNLDLPAIYWTCPRTPEDEEGMADAREALEGASLLGVEVLVCSEGGRPEQVADEDFANLARVLDELQSAANRYNIAVAYHPHLGALVETREDIDRLFAGVTAAGLCVDPGHIGEAGSDPVAVIQAYQSRLVHLHLREWQGEEMHEVLGGRGSNDGIQRVLDVLAETGYERWASVELFSTRREPLALARKARLWLEQRGY
jgi:inosose dehydratase